VSAKSKEIRRKSLAGSAESASKLDKEAQSLIPVLESTAFAANYLGQKTPPFAGANRRGRNREEAVLTKCGKYPTDPRKSIHFAKIYKLSSPHGEYSEHAGSMTPHARIDLACGLEG